MTRLGFYIIHNTRNTLVHMIDVPWDFNLNAEDGTVIKPNPLPPTEETTDGFTWNSIAAERAVLYIRKKVFWHPVIPIMEIHPYKLRYATFLMTFELAEKLHIISIEDRELMEKTYRPYSKELKDINSVIYLTNDFPEEDTPMENNVKIVTEKNIVYYTFKEGEIPDFSDPEYPTEPIVPELPDVPEIDPDDPEAGIDPHSDSDGSDIEIPPDPFEVNEEKLNEMISGILSFNENKKHTIFIPFFEALETEVLKEVGIEPIKELDMEIQMWIHYLNGNRVIFTEGVDEILIIPSSENKIVISAEDENVSIKYLKKPNNNEKFIIWFRKYFYTKLLTDRNFLNKFNTDRDYFIILQENNEIMGRMSLYKGRNSLNFMQHDYRDIIEERFPDIRDKMFIKDEQFGGHEEDIDKDYLQDYTPNVDGQFGGYDDDSGFLI